MDETETADNVISGSSMLRLDSVSDRPYEYNVEFCSFASRVCAFVIRQERRVALDCVVLADSFIGTIQTVLSSDNHVHHSVLENLPQRLGGSGLMAVPSAAPSVSISNPGENDLRPDPSQCSRRGIYQWGTSADPDKKDKPPAGSR